MVQKAASTNGKKPLYPNAAVLETRSLPKLQKRQVLVKINAVSFNHRDVSGMAANWGTVDRLIPNVALDSEGSLPKHHPR